MQEEWKSIKGFENSYEVSNLGNVRSIDRYCIQKNNRSEKYNHIYKGKILKQFKNKAGYMQVQLSYRYKSYPKRVHRLVAETFIDNPNNYSCVNHIDGNKLNNNVDNLEWCSQAYNLRHAYRTGLKNNDHLNKKIFQYDLDDNLIKVWNSQKEIIDTLGYTQSVISHCCRGKTKSAYGYKWKYFEGKSDE